MNFSEFLPHGPELQLLKSIIRVNKDSVVCSAEIGKPSVPGFNTEAISTFLCVELVAQAAATFIACNSFDSILSGQEKRPKQGVVLSLNEMSIFTKHLTFGQIVLVEASPEFLSETSAVFAGRVLDQSTQKELFVTKISLHLGTNLF